MKKFNLIRSKKNLLFLLFLIFLSNFLLKIFRISSIPPGMTYDELVYVAESQVILKHGTDVSGEWRPWHFSPSKPLYSELTSTTLVPGFLLFPNNPMLASKIIPVLMGSMIPVFLALVIFYFFKNKTYLISVALVATLNPWIFQFSRMGFDSLFSIFFYLLGIVSLLYLKKWWKLLAIAPFFWGFFQYQGHKVILVPVVALIYLSLLIEKFIEYKKGKSSEKLKKAFIKNLPTLLVFVFTLLLTINYLSRLRTMSSSVRSEEFSLINQEVLANIVIEQRRLTLTSPLVEFFDNKLTACIDLVYRSLLKSFDPYLLFLRGDLVVDTFTVTDYGFFHRIDIVLILLFFILIARSVKNFSLILFFIFLFIFIGTFPNLIKNQETWITFRGSFAFLGLVMMAGVGLGLFASQLKTKKIRIFLVLFYLLCTSSFFYTYFFRYPITQTLHKGFYQRVLANYIDRNPDKKFVLVTDLTTATYDYLLTYNQYIETESELMMNEFAQESNKKIDNGRIRIFESCPENLNTTVDENTILIVDWLKEPCDLEKKKTSDIEIVSLIDSGTHFSISNDQLCSQFSLLSHLDLKQNYLAVEKLDLETFCSSFFVRR
jgi:hypothetical protein